MSIETPRRSVSVPLFRRSKRRGLTSVPARADVLALSSVLLGYPDDDFYQMVPQLEEMIEKLPASSPASHLKRFWDQFSLFTPTDLRREYVETFDLRRKSSLFLTYYLHGDTRQRGMALLALKQRYRATGFTPEDDELPDYLPMVLEFAARAGSGTGEAVLRTHRGGIELIRRALDERESPYREILDAISALLGPITDRQNSQVVELARNGPPTETTGLDSPVPPYGAANGASWNSPAGLPFGPPEFTHAPKGR